MINPAIKQSADDLAAVDQFCDAFEAAGTNRNRMSPAAVGSRALANRETLREVADLSGALGLAGELLGERGHDGSPEWLEGDYYPSCLLSTCEFAAAQIYESVADVVGENDDELKDGTDG